jgi:myo-inositol catabolism protein IolC
VVLISVTRHLDYGLGMHRERKPLYILACDHRASFRRALFGEAALTPKTAARASDAKRIVLEGLLWAIDKGADRRFAGILVDTETAADVARDARELGIAVAIPVERGGGRMVFEFEYGAGFGAHIERYDPDYAKALVQYNPGTAGPVNALQRARLGELSRWLLRARRRLLLELLVPPTAAQLQSVGGDRHVYDAHLRPHLMVVAIAQLQDAGIRPDVWKIEGVDAVSDYRLLVAQCRSREDTSVSCIVLGRGANLDQVCKWLGAAGRVPGVDGFAVGRSIWMSPLLEYVAGRIGRRTSVERIGSTYSHLVRVFERSNYGSSSG